MPRHELKYSPGRNGLDRAGGILRRTRLLLLIVVAVQATGALAWIPAVRRLRGEDEPIPA